jgi:hypothetical protein
MTLHAWPGFTRSNIVDHISILECSTLTMNSVIALMASHNIVHHNSRESC